MRRSAIAVGLITLLAAFANGTALAGNLLSFKFVMQQSCIFSQAGFTDEFDIIGGGNLNPITVIGSIDLDIGSGLAFEVDQAILQSAVGPPPPGSPPAGTGQFPVQLYVSQCIFDFHLSSDLSFTIAHKGHSCHSTGQNGPNKGVTFTNVGGKVAGQFSPEFESFVGGTAADKLTLVETVLLPDGNPAGQRICATTMQGVRVISNRK